MVIVSGVGERWFYVREGRRVGPFDRQGLVDELLALDGPEGILVWHTGLPAWTRAGLLDELKGLLPPPLPGTVARALGLPARDHHSEETPDPPSQEALPDLPDAPDGEPVEAGDGEGLPPLAPEEAGAEDDPAHGSSRRRRRRRHRHRAAPARRFPPFVLPLALLFVAVMWGLWILLRRMNEAPPGQILQQSEGRPSSGGPPPRGIQA